MVPRWEYRCLPYAYGLDLYRLLVYSAVGLVIMVQVGRGWQLTLPVTRAVGEEEAGECNPKKEADDHSIPPCNGNKASQKCTQRDERQAKDDSEMFHKTCLLSS